MRKTISDGLLDNECRWPYDTSPTTFCCEPKERGSYCAEHAKLVYVAASAPKRPRQPFMLPVDVIPVATPVEPEENRPDLVVLITPVR